jgi:hypothetical protein
MRAALAAILAIMALSAQAQGTWVGECTVEKPCAVVADVPAAPAGATLATCTLNGAPGGVQTKPIVAKATLPAPFNTNVTIKDPTCFWYPLTLASGTYSFTAAVADTGGRSSPLTDPLSVTVLQPIAPPANLRLLGN